MREALRRLWLRRTERERSALYAGAAFIALAIAYAYSWLPVVRERDRLLERVPELRITAQEMNLQAQNLERLRNAARPAARDLKMTIELAVAASGMVLAQSAVTRKSAERVHVAVSSVHVRQWLDCIARLQSSQAVRLESGRILLDERDRVKVEAIFVRLR